MTVESLPASEGVADSAGYEPEVSVIVPVLNEAGTVGELSERVAEVLDRIGRRFEILFVDDGSADETRQRVKEAHEIDNRVKLVSLRRNFGKAAALCAGFDHSRGEILITMDGDLQDDPGEIPRFLEKLQSEDLDLVSGWKQQRQDPASKRYPSWLFNWVTRKLASVDLHDFNCGFKAYRREVLDEIALYGELHRYIPVLASRRGFSLGELSVVHQPREHGTSKYGFGNRAIRATRDMFGVKWLLSRRFSYKIKAENRPEN